MLPSVAVAAVVIGLIALVIVLTGWSAQLPGGRRHRADRAGRRPQAWPPSTDQRRHPTLPARGGTVVGCLTPSNSARAASASLLRT
jgi:hypothetical protein